jgi:NAD(P)-dependent dehydrogenase (short-subunit alcohol dehydrogenase family)
MRQFAGKVALITGGNAGIGCAAAIISADATVANEFPMARRMPGATNGKEAWSATGRNAWLCLKNLWRNCYGSR